MKKVGSNLTFLVSYNFNGFYGLSVTDNLHPTPSYIESRFESHVKTLINRTDRLESLMERLLEASLANNELMGEMFKEMKTFMMSKQDQTQSFEKPSSADVKPADEETRLEDDRMEEEEVVEPPIKIIRKESSIRIGEEPKVESDAEFIPVEIIESEDLDENYSDEKLGPEHEYLEDTSEQLQQKAFHLPLKTVEELLMFDQELKASADFRNDMVRETFLKLKHRLNGFPYRKKSLKAASAKILTCVSFFSQSSTKN